MSDSTKQERVEEFLRKSLLGEELINTQFHLFSARSSPSGRVLKPRVLCANNVLLAKGSKFFVDLLSSDINPADPSFIDLIDDSDVPDHVRIDDYGYASDSDLDDCDEPATIDIESPKHRSTALPRQKHTMGSRTRPKDDDELSDDESVSSDMFVMSPEQPRTGEPFSLTKDGSGSAASSETAVANKKPVTHTAMRLRSLGTRHVLVRDSAFQTWYTLLNYLYIDKFSFLPLGSMTRGEQPQKSSSDSVDEPRCSAKSMYRLACKVGLDDLREEAFSYMRSNLTEHNILKEISCSLVSKHPELLEMELDVLYDHIGSPPVVANFSMLAQRIANRELVHGADIIVGVHTRLLRGPHPLPLQRPPPPMAHPADIENNVELEVEAKYEPEDISEDQPRPCPVDKPGSLPEFSALRPPPTKQPSMSSVPPLFTGKTGPVPVSAVLPPSESKSGANPDKASFAFGGKPREADDTSAKAVPLPFPFATEPKNPPKNLPKSGRLGSRF